MGSKIKYFKMFWGVFVKYKTSHFMFFSRFMLFSKFLENKIWWGGESVKNIQNLISCFLHILSYFQHFWNKIHLSSYHGGQKLNTSKCFGVCLSNIKHLISCLFTFYAIFKIFRKQNLGGGGSVGGLFVKNIQNLISCFLCVYAILSKG